MDAKTCLGGYTNYRGKCYPKWIKANVEIDINIKAVIHNELSSDNQVKGIIKKAVEEWGNVGTVKSIELIKPGGK